MAIENMNGQFLGGKAITVQFAFKKDGKGERHGTAAERLLANQAKWVSCLRVDYYIWIMTDEDIESTRSYRVELGVGQVSHFKVGLSIMHALDW